MNVNAWLLVRPSFRTFIYVSVNYMYIVLFYITHVQLVPNIYCSQIIKVKEGQGDFYFHPL